MVSDSAQARAVPLGGDESFRVLEAVLADRALVHSSSLTVMSIQWSGWPLNEQASLFSVTVWLADMAVVASTRMIRLCPPSPVSTADRLGAVDRVRAGVQGHLDLAVFVASAAPQGAATP